MAFLQAGEISEQVLREPIDSSRVRNESKTILKKNVVMYECPSRNDHLRIVTT